MILKKNQIRFYKEYTVELILKEPDRYFIFGDNLVKRGKRGQACIRNQNNAIGVPTKRYPCMKSKKCFFSDKIDEVIAVNNVLKQIDLLLKDNKKIGLPKDGFGTGLAELKSHSPVIFKFITLFFQRLDNRYLKKITY